MKTNYPLRGKKQKRSGAKIIFALVICLILGFFAKGVIAGTFSSVIYFTGNLIGKIIPPGFHTISTLSHENQELREKVALLAAENVDRQLLKAENIKLKEGYGRTTNEEVLYSVVLNKSPFSPFDTFILDTGTNQGVSVGDTVIVGNVAVGTIVDTGASYSKAELFSSPGKTFEGTLGSHGIKIQATGEGGGIFRAMLPIGTAVAEGDDLILPALSPKVFGTVEKVEELPTEGFKQILFSLPINPAEVSSVGILKATR